jgi:hypothetical protein
MSGHALYSDLAERVIKWDHAAQSEAKMRNLIFAINITLDDFCDHTKTIADEEMLEYYTHFMRGVDLLVFGRKTYIASSTMIGEMQA